MNEPEPCINSSHQLTTAESHLLHLLQDGRSHTLEELLEEAPEFSWAQLFIAMDHLSRSGMIEICRHGFSYWLRKIESWSVANGSHPHR